MKRVLCLSLIILMLFSGCSFVEGDLLGNLQSNITQQNNDDNKVYTPKDSQVVFNIYPDTEFDFVDKFDRLQYTMLTDIQKSVYIRLDNAVFNMQTGYIDVGECTYRDLEIAYSALRTDRPEYFWLPTVYSLRVVGKRRQIRFAEKDGDWSCTKAQRQRYEEEIAKQLQAFLKSVSSDDTEYELELKAHDWLASKVTYMDEAVDNYEAHSQAWTIVGALHDGNAVCEGYSRAMQVLCFMLGIDCSLVTGTTSGAHMWNVVKIDGQWYHLDATFNDTDDISFHSFFNVTTEYLEKGRTIDLVAEKCDDQALQNGRYNLYLPICNSMQSSYFSQNSAYISSKNQFEATVISLVYSAVTSGKKSIEIAFSPELNFVYGRTDIKKMGNIENYLIEVNAELPDDLKIKRYRTSGINGSLSFILSW